MKENSREEDMKILEDLRMANEGCIRNIKVKDSPFITICKKQNNAIEHILSDYERVLIENEELKEYIMLAPNLDEMTAMKYSNIQKEAYIRGRAEEQQKAEQIIYENYIPAKKIKEKTENLKKEYKIELEKNSIKAFVLKCQIIILEELIKEEK